jgi:hypothetical protein
MDRGGPDAKKHAHSIVGRTHLSSQPCARRSDTPNGVSIELFDAVIPSTALSLNRDGEALMCAEAAIA